MSIYFERQKEWRNISTNQLSLTNNILITVSTGYFALIFQNKTLSKIVINLDSNIDWHIFLYAISLAFIFISILYGVAVMFCRLYDFRISRHISLTRQRINSHIKDETLPDGDIGPITFWNRIIQFTRILFVRLEFISKQEIESYPETKNEFRTRFNNLRRQCAVLGRATWLWTKFQVLCFLVSFLFYILSVITDR